MDLVNDLKAVLTHPHLGRSLTPLTWPSCCDVESSSLRSRRNPGTVDPECDVTEICKETAEEVRRICRYYQMPVPNIGVETHDVTTEEHADLKFAFIPGIINYIVQEILKNSCRAALELYSSDLDRHPIQIIICGTTSIGSFFSRTQDIIQYNSWQWPFPPQEIRPYKGPIKGEW